MASLKQLRERLGLTQAQVANKLNITIPALSTYETGQATPPLEDMIILERNFSQPIEWTDNINVEDKQKITELITALSERYPLTYVLNFAKKWIKQDLRFGRPDRAIKFFTKQAGIVTEDSQKSFES
ncbi:MAG: helix-turn-helix domain-containing protein [Bacteroidetes bacterium]|nr:helix-turn-helix domain-containing protein [Bacteroidota bacterium]